MGSIALRTILSSLSSIAALTPLVPRSKASHILGHPQSTFFWWPLSIAPPEKLSPTKPWTFAD